MNTISWNEISQISFTLEQGALHIDNVKDCGPIPVIFKDTKGNKAWLKHTRFEPVSHKDNKIDAKLLKKMQLAIGTVVKQKAVDDTLYLKVAISPEVILGHLPLVDTDTTVSLKGKQIACLINLKRECIFDCPHLPFTIRQGNLNLPYEVVGKVADGTLFNMETAQKENQ